MVAGVYIDIFLGVLSEGFESGVAATKRVVQSSSQSKFCAMKS